MNVYSPSSLLFSVTSSGASVTDGGGISDFITSNDSSFRSLCLICSLLKATSSSLYLTNPSPEVKDVQHPAHNVSMTDQSCHTPSSVLVLLCQSSLGLHLCVHSIKSTGFYWVELRVSA